MIFNKLITRGLYLLVFLLPIQTRWIIGQGGNEYSTLSLYGTDILLIFVLVILMTSKIRNPKSEIRNKLKIKNSNRTDTVDNKRNFTATSGKIPWPWLLIAGLNLVSLISIIFAQDKLIALQAYMRLTLGMGLFWLILRAEFDRLKLIYYFLAGVFLQASIGIRQFLTQSTFSSKWLGLASHNVGDLGTSVVETLNGERWLRAYGGQDHPNILGGLLVVGIILTISLLAGFKKNGGQISNYPPRLAASRREAGKLQISNKIQNPKSKIQNYIYYFLYFVFLTALFFSFSRGAWVGLIVGLAVYFGFGILDFRFGNAKAPSRDGETSGEAKLSFWESRKLISELLKLIAIGAVFISILFFLYRDLALTRLSQDTRLEVKSNTERIASLRDATMIIKNNWLTGVGIGNYTLALEKFYPDQPSWFYQPAHNVFLLVWSEAGIAGIILYLGILGIVIISNFSARGGSAYGGQFFPRTEPRLREILGIRNSASNTAIDKVAAIAIIFSLITMSQVDHYFWSLHFGILLFWFVLGLAARQREELS
jgi:O-antigen ligase